MKESFSANDPIHVRKQYRTKAPLNLRIQSHMHYSQPQVDFVSGVLDRAAWNDFSVELERRIQSNIEQQGQFRVSKKTGVFVCYR
jgi:hypothetical protein